MSETRRGRKNQAEYKLLVGKALNLLQNPFLLDEFPVLSKLPAIERWVEEHPHELLPHSKALRGMLRRAIENVIQNVKADGGKESHRLAQYLHLRYQQGMLVKDIAEQWSLSVEQVWRSAGRYAVELITEEFLHLARAADQNMKPEATSPKERN